MVEGQAIRTASRQQNVHTPVPGGIEGIIADDGMVIGVIVSPLDRLTNMDGDGKGNEAVLSRHHNLPHRHLPLVLSLDVALGTQHQHRTDG